MPAVSVVIPAYNESRTIGNVVRRVRRVSRGYEIIVVDDGSRDDTAARARAAGARVVTLAGNSGKGTACRAGVQHARGSLIVFIDADLQLRPEDIPKFVDALARHDVAIGVRSMDDVPVQRRVANGVAARLIGGVAGRRFSDVLCGFRAVRRDAFGRMHLASTGYEFEVEMLLAAIREHMRISQVPVAVSYAAYRGMSPLASARLLGFILKKRIAG